MIYLAQVVFSGKHTLKVTTDYYLVFGFTKSMAHDRVLKKLNKVHGELNHIQVSSVRSII